MKRLWISTTIKRKWLDQILSGEKKIETKVATEFWSTRLDKFVDWGKDMPVTGINFLCGKESVKFNVTLVKEHISLIKMHNIDGIMTDHWYEIHLGKRLHKRMNKLCRKCGHTVVATSTDTCRFCGGYLEPIGEVSWG